MSDDTIFLTRRQQARRYGVSTRTIDRWSDDDNLGLPAEIDIAGRKYRKLVRDVGTRAGSYCSR